MTNSSYHPPICLRRGHLQTILPFTTRKVRDVRYTRSRLPTPDGDFLDPDWSKADAPRYGGHFGFMGQGRCGNYRYEERTLQFCETGTPAS